MIRVSKSMDLRWDWLRDRVAQNLFVLPYIRSLQNPADFFTKALPVHRHRELAPLFVQYPTPPSHPCSLQPVSTLSSLYFSSSHDSPCLVSVLLSHHVFYKSVPPTMSLRPPHSPRRPSASFSSPALLVSYISSGAGVLMYCIIP